MNKTLFKTFVVLFVCMLSHGVACAKMRVIIDNDFAGDPDGIYALAQLLQSPSVEVRGIIGSHLHQGENWTAKGKPAAATAVANVNSFLQMVKQAGRYTVCQGSELPLADTLTPIRNAATELIIREAMAASVSEPLYVLCGGGLTEIASAWMLSPEIAERIVVVWIGGSEYPGIPAPPGSHGAEYNTAIDIKAAQVVFNRSDLTLWQVPRNVYRQSLISYAVLSDRFGNGGSVARYLLGLLERHIGKDSPRECYVLGDSPLVLLSALQSLWESDAASSDYTWRPCPRVDDEGIFDFSKCGRQIKVFDKIDTYLMFEDMFAKLRRM